MLFSDTVFTGGSFVVHPMNAQNQITVPLKYNKNQEEKIDIKVLLGEALNAPYFLVHEFSGFMMSKFAFFAAMEST